MGSNIIPTDAPSVFAALSTLEAHAIVRPSNPPAGISGFLFDVAQDDEIHLNSEITDHYVEDNSTMQDNWAIRPEEITLNGIVAELTDAPKPSNKAATPPAALPLNPQMIPRLSQGGMQNAIGPPPAPPAAGSLYDYFGGDNPTVPRQTRAFSYFYALWKGRQVCSVETAWGIMVNMAILRIRAIQDRTSRQVCEITITFKKIRTAAAVTVQTGQVAGRAANQGAAPTNLGNAGTTPTDGSLLYTMARGMGWTP
ncbi:MAG: phage baseplate protein [Polyangia bacterium]|jgi:hypothetical protein